MRSSRIRVRLVIPDAAKLSDSPGYNTPMRYRLRTLLIVLALGPPVLAWYCYYLEWQADYGSQSSSVKKLELLYPADKGYHWVKTANGGAKQVPNTLPTE